MHPIALASSPLSGSRHVLVGFFSLHCRGRFGSSRSAALFRSIVSQARKLPEVEIRVPSLHRVLSTDGMIGIKLGNAELSDHRSSIFCSTP